MSTAATYVIVGAGLAGAKAAEALRTEGFDGRVVLIGEEPEQPYERPPLSKGYLRGEDSRDSAHVHDADFYAAQDIELLTGTTVTAIDPDASLVELDDGRRLGFQRLLLATGASPRRLDLPGADLDGIHYLRTLHDADVLKQRLVSGAGVVVVGAGWIGSEVAASARQLGAEVTIVEPQSTPLERVLGARVGAVYRDLHRSHGVTLELGTGVQAFVGAGRVEAVSTSDGRRLPADVVLVGVGAIPNTMLAEQAGLKVDNGVVVDEHLCTSAPTIFAAGDVANAYHPLFQRHVRVEHWANALNQGPAAARNMLGLQQPYERVPYFFSDQYELGMEYSGLADPADQVVFRGDPASGEFIAFWLHDEVVVAAMNAGIWDVVEPLQALIRRRARPGAARLADQCVALEALVDDVT